MVGHRSDGSTTAGQLPDNCRSTAGQVALSSGNDSKVALG